MKRITNLKDVSFPVNLQPVFIQNNGTIKAKGYKAVTGKPNGNDMIFSIVSDKYSLITNAKAFDIGTKVFSEYFESAGGGDFTIFKLTFPETKSFCHIDIINKNYKFNLWGLETYFPFMRITNSYNRTRRLKFEIGFIRRWCENGMIFEKETVHLNFIHYKNSAENILAEKNLSLDILRPLIKETALQVMDKSPSQLQTGPAIRGDEKIMQQHLNYLAAKSELAELYKKISASINNFKK